MICSDCFFLEHIYVPAAVWMYVSTWDLLHLLFYHGKHKAVCTLLYLEQVWNSSVLLSWPVYDPVLETHRLFLTLKLQDHHFSHMQCDWFRRNTLTAAWLCFLLQASSERWQRWVCACLASGSRFSLSSAIAKLLRNRASPPSGTSAAILPPLLTPRVGSVCMCRTAPGSVHSGTAGIRGHGS